MSPAQLAELTDDELMARRVELAEAVGPMLLRLEAIDDALMHRRRAALRQRILAGPPEPEHEHEGAEPATTEALT